MICRPPALLLLELRRQLAALLRRAGCGHLHRNLLHAPHAGLLGHDGGILAPVGAGHRELIELREIITRFLAYLIADRHRRYRLSPQVQIPRRAKDLPVDLDAEVLLADSEEHILDDLGGIDQCSDDRSLSFQPGLHLRRVCHAHTPQPSGSDALPSVLTVGISSGLSS